MSSAIPRAWRFSFSNIDTQEDTELHRSAYDGLSLNARGGVSMVAGDAAVRQALMLLLSTRPGERIMRPEYGCALHRLLFHPNDDTTAGLAIHYVQQAVERWEPRVIIDNIDAFPHPDEPYVLTVQLSYIVRDSQRQDQLALDLELNS